METAEHLHSGACLVARTKATGDEIELFDCLVCMCFSDRTKLNASLGLSPGKRLNRGFFASQARWGHACPLVARLGKRVENVLLRALGLVPEDMVVDDEAVKELQDLFDSPLREQHVRVIAALFGKCVPNNEDFACRADVVIGVQ